MYVRHSENVLNTHAEVCFQYMHISMGPQYLFWTSHVRLIYVLCPGRFDSDSKSEVFVRTAVLKIQTILRGISTVKFLTENADYPTIIYWSWISTQNVTRNFWNYSFCFSYFQALLYPNFTTELFLLSAYKKVFLPGMFYKGRVCVRYEYKKKNFSKFRAVRKRTSPPSKNISKMAFCARTASKKHPK